MLARTSGDDHNFIQFFRNVAKIKSFVYSTCLKMKISRSAVERENAFSYFSTRFSAFFCFSENSTGVKMESKK